MDFKYADRIEKLPPYLFAEIERKKNALKAQGVALIDLGIGDPDKPTPEHIIRAGKKALMNPQNHKYPIGVGMASFREAVARWYSIRFDVSLDPAKEIITLIGSKDGISHIHFAFVNEGDYVLVPEPAYPVYNNSTIFCGGKVYSMPLKAENGFLPVLDEIPPDVSKKAKLIFINYPNNPTNACASREFFEKIVRFARENNIIVCHDNAYSEIYFDGRKPLSFLEVEGAKDVGVEFHSLSKTYNMTGWRIGWACGNEKVVNGLAKFKENIDSGVFKAVQEAGIAALNGSQDCVEEMRRIYKDRRDVFVKGIEDLGWKVNKPQATFYVWVSVPPGYTSMETAALLLEKAHVICTPGNGFGPSGEGYVRFALTVDTDRLREALSRFKKIFR